MMALIVSMFVQQQPAVYKMMAELIKYNAVVL